MPLASIHSPPTFPPTTFTSIHDCSNNPELSSSSSSPPSTPSWSSKASFLYSDTSVDRTTDLSSSQTSADVTTTDTPASLTMKIKLINKPPTKATVSPDAKDNQRTSGRVRKPTAKAVALKGNKSYSPPLLDTIVVGEKTPKRRGSSTKDGSPPSAVLKDEAQKIQTNQSPSKPSTEFVVTVDDDNNENDNDNTHATPSSNNTAPVPPALAQDSASSARRQSQRERRISTKAASETPASSSRKRSAGDDFEDSSVRKSIRLTNSAVKVPSKLRHSVSSDSTNAQNDIDQTGSVLNGTAAPRKSLIVILKYGKSSKVAPPPSPPATRRRAIPASRREKLRKISINLTTTAPNSRPPAAPRPVLPPLAAPPSCDLSCLSPSSRLLAMAQIARDMPDDKNDEMEPVPGSANDWRMYMHAWCQCAQPSPQNTTRTNSAELERALMPNTVAKGTKDDAVDLTAHQPTDAELLATPVGTIMKAADAERLSKLYAAPGNLLSSQVYDGTRNVNGKRCADNLAAPLPQPFPKRPALATGPELSDLSDRRPSPSALRRTFEDRIRDDYNALADIRKRAAARRIPWSYNQTYDDIHFLIMDAEEREQQAQYRQQAVNPPTALGRGGDNQVSPTGFGVLLPPRGTPTFIRGSGAHGQQSRTQSPSSHNPATANGASARKQSGSDKLNLVDENRASSRNDRVRRASSPARPKSSRFRVDPRGLQGQSPGPGTIINMAEKAEEQKELKKLRKALKEAKERRKAEDRAKNALAAQDEAEQLQGDA
jgi:hypothetical protein